MSIKEKLSRAQYWRSDKGRETRLRYRRSKKGYDMILKWRRSPKGRASIQAARRRLRQDCLRGYCGEIPHCMCLGCPVIAWEILEIDHLKNNGNKQRKRLGVGKKFYQWLKRNHFPKGYRVVCPNCHAARHAKIPCPHHNLPGVNN